METLSSYPSIASLTFSGARRGEDAEDEGEASVGRAGSCLSWKVAVAAGAVAVRDEALVVAVPLPLPTAAEVEAGLCWALGWAASRSGLPLAVLVVVVVVVVALLLLLRPLRLRLRWRWLAMVALAGRRRSSCVSADGADGAGCDETRESSSCGRRPGDRELSGLINAAAQP